MTREELGKKLAQEITEILSDLPADAQVTMFKEEVDAFGSRDRAVRIRAGKARLLLSLMTEEPVAEEIAKKVSCL